MAGHEQHLVAERLTKNEITLREDPRDRQEEGTFVSCQDIILPDRCGTKGSIRVRKRCAWEMRTRDDNEGSGEKSFELYKQTSMEAREE